MIPDGAGVPPVSRRVIASLTLRSGFTASDFTPAVLVSSDQYFYVG